ncbi:MAG TPA: phospholipase D family protein [Planctomycetaceae bacterium]|nr:phospholipase D family protein [Planctomycetaceae bacterium]
MRRDSKHPITHQAWDAIRNHGAIVALLVVVCAFAAFGIRSPNEPSDLTIHFSPNGGAAEAVVREIEAAKKTMDVAAFTITHPDISRAIIHAHQRGVNVRVVMDPTQATARYSAATPLFNAGIPVYIERGAGLLHHKLAIIDSKTVITGSMNWSRAGDEVNDEDLVIIRDEKIAKIYAEHFNTLIKNADGRKAIQCQ